jgi:hypothetical protein
MTYIITIGNLLNFQKVKVNPPLPPPPLMSNYISIVILRLKNLNYSLFHFVTIILGY